MGSGSLPGGGAFPTFHPLACPFLVSLQFSLSSSCTKWGYREGCSGSPHFWVQHIGGTPLVQVSQMDEQ